MITDNDIAEMRSFLQMKAIIVIKDYRFAECICCKIKKGVPQEDCYFCEKCEDVYNHIDKIDKQKQHKNKN
jgi:hypothetical protein